MILECLNSGQCTNSTADCLYGRKRRPHTALATHHAVTKKKFPGPPQYMCTACYYVRSYEETKSKHGR
jgi:hypothetical protein